MDSLCQPHPAITKVGKGLSAPAGYHFPEVLKLGELLINIDNPNAAIFCMGAAYCAGTAQGLILAMDRDTVIKHRLQWTIDDADTLFEACGLVYLQAFADRNANDKDRLENVKEMLSGRIQIIQEKLRYAHDVKLERDEDPICRR